MLGGVFFICVLKGADYLMWVETFWTICLYFLCVVAIGLVELFRYCAKYVDDNIVNYKPLRCWGWDVKLGNEVVVKRLFKTERNV